ncbi:MAG: MFS transporter [Thermoplasmata archaeon]|nr:MAG: MFS transporter [Thermoplasmata archaeon]
MGKNVFLLGITSFLNDFSSEMIMPILPMFLLSLGGGGFVVGVVGGLRDSLSSLLKVIFGHISDRTGRRKVYVTSGYITSSLFKLLLALSKAWQHVLLFTSLERVGKGMRTAARDAIIADSIPTERGRGFGIHRALDTSGAVAGSATVLLLLLYLNPPFRRIILLAALLAFLSLLPLALVKEVRGRRGTEGFLMSLRALPSPLKRFIVASTIFSLANFSYMFFILKAHEAFPGELSVALPVLLYLLFNIFYAAFSIPFGRLSDRVGRRPVIASGYLLFSLTSLGFTLARGALLYGVLFALYGVVYAIVDGNQRAYVSDLSPGELRGTALGSYHTLAGLAALPGSIIAGLLWEVNSSMTFLYGALMASAASIVLLSLMGEKHKERRPLQ